jgi:hypothetical protein
MTTEREEELESSPLTVDDTDVASMELHSILHDGKSKAGSADIAGTAFFYAVEALKYIFQMFIRHSFTSVILSEIAEFFDGTVAFQMNSYVVSSVLETVLDKVSENSIDQGPVTSQNGSGAEHIFHLYFLGNYTVFKLGKNLIGHVV